MLAAFIRAPYHENLSLCVYRVAPSFVRFGTFQLPAQRAGGQEVLVKQVRVLCACVSVMCVCVTCEQTSSYFQPSLLSVAL